MAIILKRRNRRDAYLQVLVSLIHKDSHQAINYTQKLSVVYRYVLTQNEKHLVYVYEELDLIATYVEILRIRFGEALSCHIELSNEAKEQLIAPLSLQILVENAVKHNIVSSRKPLVIKIYQDESYLIISNNYNLRRNVKNSTGVGLNNLITKYGSTGFCVELPIH